MNLLSPREGLRLLISLLDDLLSTVPEGKADWSLDYSNIISRYVHQRLSARRKQLNRVLPPK